MLAPTQVTEPYAYDERGLLRQLHRDGVLQFERYYDARGRLIEEVTPRHGPTREPEQRLTSYDAAGRVATQNIAHAGAFTTVQNT